ncbi:type II toxin-antitoxin system Phd/YefM family antitoxin [Niabella hirudinis]|uniref:type II toxin-antitoxin system Phd/YefM family antitoxin n=1 Tax=Niabella hirudinis TaxID=1285929 RepID=UPI003EBDA776
MLVANISEFRKNLKSYIDQVSDNNDTLIVTGSGKTVVMISLDDFNSYDETEYLLSNDANKAMMYKAKKEIETGNTTAHTLKDLKNMIND